MTDLPSIMSIRELIDTAFGDADTNVVHHKLIQTILIILARQLRLLERRVEVEIGPYLMESSGTSISVSEVKLHANVPRKKKGKGGITSSAAGTKTSERGEKSHAKVAGKSSVFAGRSVTDKSTTDKSSTDKSSSVVTSSATKSITEPSSSLKSSTEKSSTDKTKSSTTDTKYSTTDKTSSDKTSSDKTSTEKTISDKTSTEKSSSSYKTSSEKTSTEKSSSDKTSSGQTSSAKTSTEKSTTDKTSSGKTSGDKTSSIKPSTEATSSDKAKGRKSTTGQVRKYENILEVFEERREREIRVIHQRADSREEQDRTPTPMSSLDSMEKQYEKLLIVERKSKGEATESDSRGKTPRLSVVTQEEFGELTAVVRQLQSKFAAVGIAALPENAKLMNDLRKGASLTDAMAALQLSARVEAAEKTLEKMLSLVTDLASRTGINLEETMATKEKSGGGQKPELEQKTEVLFGAGAAKKKSPKEAASKSRKSLVPKLESKESIVVSTSRATTPKSETQLDETPPRPFPVEVEEVDKEPKDMITYEELDNALQELYDEFVKVVSASTTRSNTNANNALKIANTLESKIDKALDVSEQMHDLERLVAEYAEQINTLDTGLSSQMTNYQEQLTQMQHDLETGLETMAEALANTGGDTAAVAELNNQFTNLQNDLEVASVRQKELRIIQNALSYDLESLWKQIEILRDTKSDRDEVADALRDKAGLAALNGLVSRQEFDAVRGDFEKRIGSAYDKFNNQEVVWQKAIDDLFRELSEKADWIQVVSLQGSINQYLDKMRAKIQDMADVVGEPRAAAVTRKLHRDADCLSCSSPAHMDLEAMKGPPALPAIGTSRPPAVGAEAESKPGEHGDHRVCYPGMPVPHAVDPRAHICNRYCGGSHTVINTTISRAPVGMIISPALKKVNTAMGTDGKLYLVDDMDKVRKPCGPCNIKMTTTPEPSEAEPAPFPVDYGSDMMPSDFLPSMQAFSGAAVNEDRRGSVTPPPPIDD